MKKCLLSVFASFIIVSCGGNADPDVVEATIVGTWKESKSVIISGKDGSVISTTPTAGCDLLDTYQFKSDNKFTFTLHSGANCGALDINSGTYSVIDSGTHLKLKHSDLTENQVTIQKLTQNELELFEQVTDYNNDGFLDKEISFLYK